MNVRCLEASEQINGFQGFYIACEWLIMSISQNVYVLRNNGSDFFDLVLNLV